MIVSIRGARAATQTAAVCLLLLVCAACDNKTTVSSRHGLTVAPASELRIANGDFSDLSGLKPAGHNGWHHGVADNLLK